MDGVVEIITGRERRSTTDKLRLVAEPEEAGTSVRAVAASHGICESLLFTWRRQVRQGALLAAPDVPMFMPVQMISGAAMSPSPSASHPVRPASASRAAAAPTDSELSAIPSAGASLVHLWVLASFRISLACQAAIAAGAAISCLIILICISFLAFDPVAMDHIGNLQRREAIPRPNH